MATSPGVRSPLGCPPHLRDALVPSGSHSRGSWSPSPMPSRAGSHVPGRAAVPAPPSLALYPMAGRQAGGRGGLWADAGAVRPGQMPPVCHPLGDAAWLCTAPQGQRVRNGCCAGRGGRRPFWLGRGHLPRSPDQKGGFQRRPSFTRFAWCWRGGAHRWTSMLTRSLPSAASPPLPPLRCLPSAASPPPPP